MPTLTDILVRVVQLEEQLSAYKVLSDERSASNKWQIRGMAVLLLGLLAWAAAQGFDLGGLASAVG